MDKGFAGRFKNLDISAKNLNQAKIMPKGKARKAAWIKGEKNCPKMKKNAKNSAPAKPRQARASGLGMAIALDKGKQAKKIKGEKK